VPPRILVSAGEASGDRYAARLVDTIRRRFPQASFFGCAGHEMQASGVETVVDTSSLAVVGLVEVVHHVPRIYGEFRKLVAAARREHPALAILTDSPDFHLRLAASLKRQGIPVVYLVAPQLWAWREGRVKSLRRNVDQLHCIFPFEEKFFRRHGVEATYIGHPLSRLIRRAENQHEFRARHGLPREQALIALCPGSRPGEINRHLPIVVEAVRRIAAVRPASFVLGTPAGFSAKHGTSSIDGICAGTPIRRVEGETWDLLGAADLSLVASGTVTVEAALLGAPMIAFYRVTGASWLMGKLLVKVPFYSMVNLIAGERIVPELIQDAMTPERLSEEALRLLNSPDALAEMRARLDAVARELATEHDPLERSTELMSRLLERN